MNKDLTEDEKSELIMAKIAVSVLELDLTREERVIEFTRRCMEAFAPDDTRDMLLEIAEPFALKVLSICDKERMH